MVSFMSNIFCCCSVTKSCPTLCYPMDCSTAGFLSLTIFRSLLKLMSIESVMPSNHLVLCRPLLLLPSSPLLLPTKCDSIVFNMYVILQNKYSSKMHIVCHMRIFITRKYVQTFRKRRPWHPAPSLHGK